jgi:uncharacterized protein YndB with AHSA1/START domain
MVAVMAEDLQTDEPADAGEGDRAQVTRTVDIAAGADAVWDAVADPDLRATWLDDPDALSRAVRVDEVDAGRRMVWTWWRDDEGPGASTVEIALRPLDGGGTRVVVTETLAVPIPVTLPAPAGPAPRARAGAAARATRAWDRRLLGLELVFVGVLAGAR